MDGGFREQAAASKHDHSMCTVRLDEQPERVDENPKLVRLVGEAGGLRPGHQRLDRRRYLNGVEGCVDRFDGLPKVLGRRSQLPCRGKDWAQGDLCPAITVATVILRALDRFAVGELVGSVLDHP